MWGGESTVKKSGGELHCLVRAEPFAAECQQNEEKDFRQSRKARTPVTNRGEEVEMASHRFTSTVRAGLMA